MVGRDRLPRASLEVPRLSGSMFTISYGLAVGAAMLAVRLLSVTEWPPVALLPFLMTAVSVALLGATLKLGWSSRVVRRP